MISLTAGYSEGWKSISDNDADNPLYEMRVASGQAKGLGADNSVMAMLIKNAEVNGIIKDILLEKCLIAKIDNNILWKQFL